MSPEIRIVSYIVFVIALFIISNGTFYLFVFILLALLALRLPFQSLKKGWVPISLFLIFTFVSNVLRQHGKVVFNVGSVLVTEEGLKIASIRTARVLFMIAGAKILTATTKTEALIDGFARLLRPLERVGLPVKDFFSTMGLAVSSLPKIKEQICETYRERTGNGDVKGFWNRTRVVSTLLIPLFIQSMQSPERFFEEGTEKKKVGCD